MLKAAHSRPMEQPVMLIFNNCKNFRRTIPDLPRDELKNDDIDTKSEGHVGDECRYEITLPSSNAKRLNIKGA